MLEDAHPDNTIDLGIVGFLNETWSTPKRQEHVLQIARWSGMGVSGREEDIVIIIQVPILAT